MIESDLVGIELPNHPQPCCKSARRCCKPKSTLCRRIPLIVRPHGRPAVALMVDNLDMAQETLKAKNFKLITEHDLCLEDE